MERARADRPIGPAPPPPQGLEEAAGQGGAGGQDLVQAIAVLRGRIEEEFRISERLDSKMRQAFALGAGFFAVVQTVTFGSFAQAHVQPVERGLMLAGAIVAGAALVVIAHRVANGEELLEEADVKPEAIVGWCNEAGEDEEYVSTRLVSELSHMARRRAENNAIRAKNYDAAASATRWAMILAGVELFIAIAVRI